MKQIKSETAFKTALMASKPVLVFWSARSWCPHCVAMEPIIANAENMYPNIDFVNVDDSTTASLGWEKLTSEYLTERDGLPTFMLFRNGKRVAKKGGSCTAKVFGRWLVDAVGR